MIELGSINLRSNLPPTDLALLPVTHAVLTWYADRGDVALDLPSPAHIAGGRCPGSFVDPGDGEGGGG